MSAKEAEAFLSILISVVCGVSYIRSVLRHETKPHLFSWLIWSLIMLIAAAAQYAGEAGVAAWATAAGGLSCISITICALFYGEKHITRSDWAAFLTALAALPLWYMTSNPLTATVLVTVIDMLGYYPTFRKSYIKPYQENLFVFSIGAFGALMSLLAVENYSFTTALYPAAITVANSVFMLMLIWRRWKTAPEGAGA